MKTLKPLLLFLALFAGSANAQNWNVFNTSYRYNYKYNNSALVSQVLFTDSVKQSGNDTVYYMNRIGVECMGSCPGVTAALNPTVTVIVPNMPQFLQRTIRKYANGLVMLSDPEKLVIDPFCKLNQNWLFDSINNQTATCIGITTLTIFNITDSVKTILIAGTDTMKLSKSFGLIQYPALYAQNKYYRLVGIEKAASYDLTSLYGEKVPNAWDFYDFEIGERFCYQAYEIYKQVPVQSANFWCVYGNYKILDKALMNKGYHYTVDENWDTCRVINSPPGVPNASLPGLATTKTFTDLTAPLLENKMYPGQVIQTSYAYPMWPSYNIVKFAKDNNGIFFKYAGLSCGDLYFVLPPLYDWGYYRHPTENFLQPSYVNVAEVYAVGLGVIQKKLLETFTLREYCQTCAAKNGTVLGTETFVGLKEQEHVSQEFRLFPNPSSGKVQVALGDVPADELRVVSLFGETVVISKDIKQQALELDLGPAAPGIYVVQLFRKGTLQSAKKLVRN